MTRPISGNVWLTSDVDVLDADDVTITIELNNGEIVTVHNATVRVKMFGDRKFLQFDGMTEAEEQ